MWIVWRHYEKFPSLGNPRAKSSKGQPTTGQGVKTESPKAPDGFKYVWGYIEKTDRYGFSLKPIDANEEEILTKDTEEVPTDPSDKVFGYDKIKNRYGYFLKSKIGLNYKSGAKANRKQ